MTMQDFKKLSRQEQSNRLREIVLVFLKLGAFSFGGPAAHTAMMEREIVLKRKWLTQEKFVDLLGATNIIPGPNSTEMAIHIGFERGSIPGLFLAGISFIIPATLICLAFAMAYAQYGSLPDVSFILYGIKPVIMAIILQALFRLGKTVLKTGTAIFVALVVVALYTAGLNEILLLFSAGILVMLLKNRKKLRGNLHSLSILPMFILAYGGNGITETGKMTLSALFCTFIKIGSVLYGSGYVLIAFLETEFVRNSSVITQHQLLDAVAIGQFTPGPVLSTATFIGYLIQGTPGAIIATIGIFLPSFLFVWLLNPVIPKLRSSTWAAGVLDGLNIASMGLMFVVSVRLGLTSVTDGLTAAIFAISFFILMKMQVNSIWIIIAGGGLGWLFAR